MNYIFNVIGAGKVGAQFAKEFCRYLSAAELEDKKVYVNIFDDGDIESEDLLYSPYVLDDIGWNRAAVLAGILSEAYPIVKIFGFSSPFPEDYQKMTQNVIGYSYGKGSRIHIVFDLSNGDERASASIKKFLATEGVNGAVFSLSEQTLCPTIKIGAMRSSLRPVIPKRRNLDEALLCARNCLSVAVNMLADNQMLSDTIYFNGGFGSLLGKMPSVESAEGIPFCSADEKILVVCVGAGGTGGNFIKEFMHIMQVHENASLLVIDGDRVEPKNMARQPFSEGDMLQNKAVCLVRDLLIDHPEVENRLFAIPNYINTVVDLQASLLNLDYSKLVLVGAVDNHRARQVMESFYTIQKDIVYIDSANEWSNGETVVSVKLDGVEYSPLRSFYYPDVLTDTSPSAAELSCGAINVSAPQHLATNVASAQNIMSACYNIFENGCVAGGIAYFDSFKNFGRFQPVNSQTIA